MGERWVFNMSSLGIWVLGLAFGIWLGAFWGIIITEDQKRSVWNEPGTSGMTFPRHSARDGKRYLDNEQSTLHLITWTQKYRNLWRSGKQNPLLRWLPNLNFCVSIFPAKIASKDIFWGCDIKKFLKKFDSKNYYLSKIGSIIFSKKNYLNCNGSKK